MTSKQESKGDHVVTRNTADGGHELECLRCGAKYEPALPVSLGVFIAICEAFADEHAGCEMKKDGVEDGAFAQVIR